MPRREENVQDTFIRVREFDDRNKNDYKDFPAVVAKFNIVSEVIPLVADYLATKTSGAQSQAVEKKSVIAAAARRKMKLMAKTARALNLDDPGFRRLFSVPNTRSYPKIFAAAREFVEEGTTHKDEMLALAMRPTLIEDLAADIAAFDLANEDKANAQGETVGATAGVDAQIDRGMDALEVLDAMMKNFYEDDPVKLAEWLQARHIKRVPQRKKDETPS